MSWKPSSGVESQVRNILSNQEFAGIQLKAMNRYGPQNGPSVPAANEATRARAIQDRLTTELAELMRIPKSKMTAEQKKRFRELDIAIFGSKGGMKANSRKQRTRKQRKQRTRRNKTRKN